jgi:hypothetical protein
MFFLLLFLSTPSYLPSLSFIFFATSSYGHYYINILSLNYYINKIVRFWLYLDTAEYAIRKIILRTIWARNNGKTVSRKRLMEVFGESVFIKLLFESMQREIYSYRSNYPV